MIYSSRRYYDDRRKFARIDMGCPILFTEIDSTVKMQAICVNLSADGICIETDRRYDPGTKITVHVEPRIRISPPLTATMEVVRVETLPGNRGFRLGGPMVTLPLSY